MDSSFIHKIGSLAIGALIIIASCSQKGKSVQDRDTLVLTKKEVILSKKMIHSVKVEHYFSSLQKKDTFSIRLIGESIAKGKVHFDIRNYEGTEIFHVEMEAVELLNYSIPPNATEAEREKFIIKRMNEFFNESNFESPAIKKDETYNAYNNSDTDSATWVALKSNVQSVGFCFLVGEENRSCISYDKINHKLFKYKSCC
jgi:hypothetical protein